MSAINLSSLALTQQAATHTTSHATFWQKYFKDRKPEVQELRQALQVGDLGAAEKAYQDLVALGKNEAHRDNPFLRADRGLDFNAIGGALQRGDLDGARQAFAALQSTFRHPPTVTPSNAKEAEAVSASGVNIVA